MGFQLEELDSKQFWLEFCDYYNIETLRSDIRLRLSQEEINQSKQVLVKEGYYHYHSKDLGIDFSKARDLITKLVTNELPPIFALIYDEFWLLKSQLQPIVESILGKEAKLLPAFWAWYVDPSQENLERHENNPNYTRTMFSSFIEPHRDKGRHSLYEDGSTKFLTAWIPLSEVDPLNSCIYLVPAHRDRNYNKETEDIRSFKYPDIRALPAQPGDIIVWNQAVLHWGSMPAPRDNLQARISIGFDFGDKDNAPSQAPNFPIDYMPSFEERKALIAKQIIQYIHKSTCSQEIINFIRKYHSKPI